MRLFIFNRRPVRPPQTPKQLQLELFGYARKFIVEDGEHSETIFLVEHGQAVPLILRPRRFPWTKPPEETPQLRHARFKAAATEALRTGAEAVIVHAEAWVADEDQIGPGQRASQTPQRKEMLSSALLQRDGETMLVFCLVDKTEDGSVVLSETYGKADSTFYNLEPFYRLWGLPLNDETGRLGDAEFGPKSAKKPGSRLSPG